MNESHNRLFARPFDCSGFGGWICSLWHIYQLLEIKVTDDQAQKPKHNIRYDDVEVYHDAKDCPACEPKPDAPREDDLLPLIWRKDDPMAPSYREIKRLRESIYHKDHFDALKLRVAEVEREALLQTEACDSLIALNNRICEERDAAMAEIERLQGDLYFLGGFGCNVPASLYGNISPIDYMKKTGLPRGAHDVAGMEMKCYGEAISVLAKLHVEHFEQLTQANARIAALEVALNWQGELNTDSLEREQRLVQALEQMGFQSNCGACKANRVQRDDALKEHKGEA